MKIAITYDKGEVFQHFGQTQQFKVYTIEDSKVTTEEVLSTDGDGHGALANLLSSWGVSKLICGGIGGGAKNALAACGIELYCGVTGNADAQIQAYLEGTLQHNPDIQCNHHGHGHDHDHDHDHDDCGSHDGSCGQHHDH